MSKSRWVSALMLIVALVAGYFLGGVGSARFFTDLLGGGEARESQPLEATLAASLTEGERDIAELPSFDIAIDAVSNTLSTGVEAAGAAQEETRLQVASEEDSAVRGKLQELQGQLEGLDEAQQRLAELQVELESARAREEAYVSTIEALRTEVITAKESGANLAELEAALKKLREQEEEWLAERERLTRELADTTAELQVALAEVEDLQGQVVDLGSSHDVLSDSLVAVRGELLAARERLAFLEERNASLVADLELALAEASRARQLSGGGVSAFPPPPAHFEEPPAFAQQEPIELQPVIGALLSLSPDVSQSELIEEVGLPVVLQSPGRVELGDGPIATVHRFDSFSGDLLASELMLRVGVGDELAEQIEGQLREVMGEPLNGAGVSVVAGDRVRFETARNAAVLVRDGGERLSLQVEHVGVAAAPVHVFKANEASTIGVEEPDVGGEGESGLEVELEEPAEVEELGLEELAAGGDVDSVEEPDAVD